MAHYTLGFSPCPNDCFMFDAMVHHKIDTEGLTFDEALEDVETLNRRAMQKLSSQLQISKMSYATYLHVMNDYALLDSGSALGRGCGPLLISKNKLTTDDVLNLKSVAIPGKYTTANMLFSLAFPPYIQKKEMLFSDVENAVVTGDVDAGVIIHENRFTYQQKGLHKIIDLGEYWETLTGCAIPLGCIAVKNNISQDEIRKIERIIRRSIEYAFANKNDVMPYVRRHAQEMEEGVMMQHINLYVNEFSLSLGTEGRKAIESLIDKGLIH